jgi:hypothetical protein
MPVLQIRNRTRQGGVGTAAAIVCFADDPAKVYLLSASHVLAPMGAAVSDEVTLVNAVGSISANTVVGHLADWTGLIDGAGYPNLADAAVAELVTGIDPKIAFPDLLNHAFGTGRPAAGTTLATLSPSGARGPVRNSSASCVVEWQDIVSRKIWDYGMAGQVLGAFAVQDGDSGAAVLDGAGNFVGLVVGRPPASAEGDGPTTVIAPIDNIANHEQWQGRLLVPFGDHDIPPLGPRRGAVIPIAGHSFEEKAPGVISNLVKDINLTAIQAAGIVGNIGYESGGFQELQERGVTHGRGGYGWAQWTAGRRVEFEGWAGQNGLRVESDEANYGFLKHELQGAYRNFTAKLQRISTLEEATLLTDREYQIPGDVLGPSPTYRSYPDRLDYARRALVAYQRVVA